VNRPRADRPPSQRRLKFCRLSLVVVCIAPLVVAHAWAGHEIPFYPSFYPQEIKIDVMEPAAAARLLRTKAIHAYVGADPFAGGAAPGHVTYVESLKSYMVLTFTRQSPPLADAGVRCAMAARILKGLAPSQGVYTFHPYPVTPYHDDYFAHVDLVEAAKKRIASATAAGPPLRVWPNGKLAEALVPPQWRGAQSASNATLEEIDLHNLEATPPPLLSRWFPALGTGLRTAFLAQAGTVIEGELAGSLQRSQSRPFPILRQAPWSECKRLTAGYTVRREALNVEYSEGVENIAYDALTGLNSAIFIRDVKLKDFPWNGWLRLGVETKPTSAWNPVAGFTDATGRLIWSAIGDPPMLPAPYGGEPMPNRVRATVESEIRIPPDALVLDPATRVFKPAGRRGDIARSKVAYEVLASKFHDDTKMTVADLLYPFVFAYRWGGLPGDHRQGQDPVVARSTASLRESLLAVKVASVDSRIRDYGDVQLLYEVPRINVYLRSGAGPGAVPTSAPWSTTPWQLTVLMEEAVTRGLAAFSEAEARRGNVPWLDLVRDQKLKSRLASLLDGFERQPYVPDSLRGLVTVEQARQRWAALKRFYRKHGHFLVTNGPYRLDKWSANSVTLGVFRDLSYPIALGSFDRYAIPRRAYVTKTERRGDRLEIEAEVETVTKFARSYKIEREPYKGEPAGQTRAEGVGLVAHYAVIGEPHRLMRVGASSVMEGRRLIVDPRGELPPGEYRVALALVLDGNFVQPEVKVVPYRVAD